MENTTISAGQSKTTPKDFFLWAGAMVALYASVISFITLLFEYVNVLYPDPLTASYVDPYAGAVRYAMASLIVLVPTALLLLQLIRRTIAEDASKAHIWVRRWLLVLTVFVASATIVIDLITLINTFLGGELTMRFALKVVIVLVVAGAALLHFLRDLKGYYLQKPAQAKMVASVAAVLSLAAIVSGFFIIGTPGELRLVRYDDQKVSDLQNIQYQLVNYYQLKEKIPASLQELADPLSGFVMPVDAQSGQSYTYRVTGRLSFELCATFNAESNGAQVNALATKPMQIGDATNENWQHPAGEHCFTRTIDPELYPPFPKTVR